MKQAALNKQNLEFLIKRYANDIEGFAIDLFGFKKFDEWQQWLNTALLDRAQTKIAIAAAHSVGKTMEACIASLHRLLCFPEARILITSATEGQLKAAFVTTLHGMIERSVIKDWFDVTTEQIVVKGLTGSWIRLRAWSEHRPEAFAGVHCMSPLFIFDEASGISPKIYEAVQGSLMHPNSKLLLLGNPLHRKGELWDAFHSKRGSYTVAHVSALDSSFISQKWIDEMRDTYGEDSDIYRVRVLGKFPKQDVDGFINEDVIAACSDRSVSIPHAEPILGGLDIGKYRDASVLYLRQGKKVTYRETFRTRNTLTVAELVHKIIVDKKVFMVAVDANGLGTGCYERLEQLAPDNVMRVDLSNLGIINDKEFYNKRARLWGRAKKWMNYGSIPDEYIDVLKKQGSSLLFSYDKHGRILLESKKEAAARGIGSPDDFDAFAYTFAPVIPVMSSLDVQGVEQYNDINVTWY
jgi:hypothetical protein